MSDRIVRVGQDTKKHWVTLTDGIAAQTGSDPASQRSRPRCHCRRRRAATFVHAAARRRRPESVLILSIRTRTRRGSAGALAQQIVGTRGTAGGHGTMAGGQVPLHGQDAATLAVEFGQIALRYLEIDPQTEAKSIVF